MDYTYLNMYAQGGQVDEIASLLVSAGIEEEEASQYSQMFQQLAGGPDKAQAAVQQMLQQGADEQQVAQQILQLVQQALQQQQGGAAVPAQENGGYLYKCGGKVKSTKAVKKGCGGLKALNGVKFEKKASSNSAYFKGGKKMSSTCPCKLRKLGGRLVNIDCNGNIVR